MSDLARGRGVNKAAAVARVGGLAAVLLAASLGAGCSYFSDDAKPDAMYGGSPAEAPAGAAFPDLRDVPETRPQTTPLDEREGIADGLIADRDKAYHSDDVLRGGTEPPAPAPVVAKPTPVPALDGVSKDPALDKQSLYEAAPTLPMPGRGGHHDIGAVMKTAAVEVPESEAAAGDEAAASTEETGAPASEGPEVTAVPTKKVTVKPVVGARP
tara:strand:+ start:83 stop:721 length:639 start_codon:yes stop_codon:yes gene_type:complete